MEIHLDRKELLLLPGKDSPTHDLTITFDNSVLTPTQTAIGTWAAQVVVQALVISHLDYCSTLLAGLPASAIRPLQLIQNAAAPLPVHSALPIGLMLPHCEVITHQNHDCLLSWLLNGGMSSHRHQDIRNAPVRIRIYKLNQADMHPGVGHPQLCSGSLNSVVQTAHTRSGPRDSAPTHSLREMHSEIRARSCEAAGQ
ncbi:unnamed protein product [Pleuronectes platessa]|uniref:Uncharacterized protein n=1 Tax=Pleuronectes platessa TaxID=8262 RepID=A0A9N7TH18_PLEPL|nr:unnamed protein product [Pleuronectes platessa]